MQPKGHPQYDGEQTATSPEMLNSIVYFICHNTSTVYNEFIDLDGVLQHVSAYGIHHQAGIHY
jgi:hypothetical protein